MLLENSTLQVSHYLKTIFNRNMEVGSVIRMRARRSFSVLRNTGSYLDYFPGLAAFYGFRRLIVVVVRRECATVGSILIISRLFVFWREGRDLGERRKGVAARSLPLCPPQLPPCSLSHACASKKPFRF